MATKKARKKSDPAKKTGESSELTPQQELFIKEYLVDFNGTRAAKAAGYSVKTAYSIASENLRKPEIATKIRAVLEGRFKKLDIKAEEILQVAAEIAYFDPGELFDEAGRLRPLHLLPREVRRVISSIDITPIIGGPLKRRRVIDYKYKIKFWNKNHADELLGKNQKLWYEMIQHSGTIGLADRLAKARKRREEKK